MIKNDFKALYIAFIVSKCSKYKNEGRRKRELETIKDKI